MTHLGFTIFLKKKHLGKQSYELYVKNRHNGCTNGSVEHLEQACLGRGDGSIAIKPSIKISKTLQSGFQWPKVNMESEHQVQKIAN